MTNLIDLCARQRIRKLFGDRPTISESQTDDSIHPRTDGLSAHGRRVEGKADVAEVVGVPESRPWAGMGHGRAAAPGVPSGLPQQPDSHRPIYFGADTTPCDT